jgi:FkbM family methyltransferase
MKMRLNPKTERHFLWGTHEGKVQSVLARFVTPGMTAYNLGAHIGFFTLALMNLVKPNGQVFAFEPSPRVRERLIDNLSLNREGDRVRVEEWALSDFDGQADFSLGYSYSQGRFGDLPYADPEKVIRIHCKRLDTYVEEGGPPPDFILMDVEHAEGRVLRGMRKILESHRPVLLVEMHGIESIRVAWNEFEKQDYQLAKLPDLKVIRSVSSVSYGHFLATPRKLPKQDFQ